MLFVIFIFIDNINGKLVHVNVPCYYKVVSVFPFRPIDFRPTVSWKENWQWLIRLQITVSYVNAMNQTQFLHLPDSSICFIDFAIENLW